MVEGCTTKAFRLGANCSISATQLASNEAGATSRLGCFSLFFRPCTSSSDSTWMVFPRPMSSARQAPSPSPPSKCSHCTPAF